MAKKARERGMRYEDIAKGATGIEPYSSTTEKQVCSCLEQDEVMALIVKKLGNRIDAQKMFTSAVIFNWRFWLYVLAPVVVISCVIGYLFMRFPETLKHSVEKVVNSQIPDLFPSSVTYPSHVSEAAMPPPPPHPPPNPQKRVRKLPLEGKY